MQHRRLLLRSLCTLTLLGLLTLLPPAALRAAGVIYVVPGGTSAQTGTDWANAKDLQTALQGATSGDEIWVKAGIYKPTTGAGRNATFQLKSGVALYGGFAGTEASRNQRDPATYISILSGDLLGNDAGVVISSNATRSENSFHVVTGSGTDTTAILDGFTITGGNAFDSHLLDAGGGIFIESGSPILSQLMISDNSSVQAGGGMANQLNSHPALDNVVFSNNNTINIGGGMFNKQSSPTIRHSLFIGNAAAVSGGGMVNTDNSHPIIDHTTFRANSAALGGGMNNGSDVTIANTVFISNTATTSGGGMLNESNNSTIVQSIFSGNISGTYGSGMANFQSNPTISQVTFSANLSMNDGGTLVNQVSSPLIYNSVFWGNQGGQIYNYLTGNNPNVQFSLVQGGYITGTHILDTDPLFVDANGADNTAGTPDDDLRLLSSSPAINAGNNTFIPADLTDDNNNSNTTEAAPFDLAGNARLVGATVDLGAYETPLIVHFASPPPPAGTYGSSYSHIFTVSARLPVTYNVTAGNLPSGLVLNAATGQLSGVPTAAGSYSGITVTASNADSSDSQTFAILIDPATLTISANNKVKHIGAANPVLTASYSGFVNNDTPASLDMPVSLTTTATLASPVGMYPITASGATDANYTISFASGSLTVTNKLVPTITWAAPQAITYGVALGPAQLNATSDISGTFSYTPAASTMLNSGNSQPLLVTFTPDDSATYEVVESAASINVQPAALTITADAKTRLFGNANPTLTASYSGFVNGDTPASLDTPVSLTTTATIASPLGIYPITASGAADTNYAITFINATLTISSRHIYLGLIIR